MENHSETINNEDKEIKKKIFDKVFKVFDKVLFESSSRSFKDEKKLENTEEDILENLLYINKYLIQKKKQS